MKASGRAPHNHGSMLIFSVSSIVGWAPLGGICKPYDGLGDL